MEDVTALPPLLAAAGLLAALAFLFSGGPMMVIRWFRRECGWDD